MWCKACQQDVPGLISAATGRYTCPRCGVELCEGEPGGKTETRIDRPPRQAGADRDGPVPVGVGPEPPPAYDGWELEQQLRHIERLLGIDKPDRAEHEAACQREIARLHATHAGPAGWHYPAAARAKAAKRRSSGASSTEIWLPALTWTVLSVGLMASVCGGVLLAWASVAGRQDLWAIGMPVGLGGQIVLVIGLILQLDRLWNDNRDTAEKLDHVGQRLHDLNKATTLLGTSHGSTSFYSHMAGGASPQLLLADLKSQLDLLAVKLGQEER